MSKIFSVIVVCGNDGTGKSTIVSEINKLFGRGEITFIAVERSTELDLCDPNFEKISSLNRRVLDEKTLQQTFDRVENDNVPIDCNGVPVVHVILDVPVEESFRRITTRGTADKWESKKALWYFRQRFLELGAYYGLPVVQSSYEGESIDASIAKTVASVLSVAKNFATYQSLALRTLSYEKIQRLDIENAIYEKLLASTQTLVPPSDFPMHWFAQVLQQPNQKQVLAKLVARHIVTNNVPTIRDDHSVSIGDIVLPANEHGAPYLQLFVEGESKRVYRIVGTLPGFEELCIIKLKSTIYSHKSQATGEIATLANVRARGSQMLLDMMARNGLPHAYRCVSKEGVVLARFVQDIPPTEIVVKRYFIGTDKHNLLGFAKNPSISIPETGEFKSGPYVRFDCRNPNHVDRKTLMNPVESPYYYVVEQIFGKDLFFEKFLKGDQSLFKPAGDAACTDALVCNVVDCERARSMVLKMFFTTQYYLQQCTPSLIIEDACYMTDASGNEIWSEINQDCCRLKLHHLSNIDESYDKDIWRAGGTRNKDMILQKWTEFNNIVGNVLRAAPFHESEMLVPMQYAYASVAEQIFNDSRLKIPPQYKQMYQDMYKKERKTRRDIIATIDLFNGQPVLVQRGKVSEIHSNGDVQTALEKISIFPNILMVDLNGAFGEKSKENRAAICKAAKNYYVHAGGGLRTIEDVQEILQNSARRIVVGTTTDSDFIAKIPKDRLIVEVSVDADMRVMTHGRANTTNLHFAAELQRLSQLGVTVISVTLHNTEGMLSGLPRDQVKNIVSLVPKEVEKIIIAGGISTIEDVEYLWSLDGRVVPQLGSAIWKNKIDVGQLVASMVSYDQQLQNGVSIAPAIVQGKDGRVKGLVWMNKQAVVRSSNERRLWRYSRQTSCLICKGESSGNVQRVLKISTDCDADALLITVDDEHPFCHNGNDSCFSLQTVIKASLSGLNDYLRRQRGNSSYTAYMQNNPGLAFAKLQEELWEVACSTSAEERKNELSDLLVHFLMYANGSGVELDDLLNELNARRHDPRLVKLVVSTSNQRTIAPNILTMAIAADKYCEKTDTYMRDNLGIVVERPPKGSRSCRLIGRIEDMNKFQALFGAQYDQVSLVGSRPKDMSFLLSRGRVDTCVTYNATMLNFPAVSLPPLAEQHVPGLSVCLVARKGDELARNIHLWSRQNKTLIAAEHVMTVSSFMQQHNIDASSVTLDRVLGSSENFLVNEGNRHYLLCDAIVESGSTLKENDLEVVFVMIDRVNLGVYRSIKRK